jgi:hypothetical protein
VTAKRRAPRTRLYMPWDLFWLVVLGRPSRLATALAGTPAGEAGCSASEALGVSGAYAGGRGQGEQPDAARDLSSSSSSNAQCAMQWAVSSERAVRCSNRPRSNKQTLHFASGRH